MARPTIDELLDVWSHRATDSDVGDATGWRRDVLDLLADGEPVDTSLIAARTGATTEEVSVRLTAAAAAGYELDDQGRLFGAALTLNPTRYRLRVRGSDLYAWCGFDTLFLPILLGEEAEVASTCPQTGQQIRLTVGADGTVSHVAPTTTLVAIVGRDVTSCCTTTGPDSAVCSQMPFLADGDAATAWLTGREGVTAVDLDDATRIARAYAARPGATS